MDEFKDDEIQHTASGAPLARKSWALVRDGVVAVVVRTYNFALHPFGEVEDAPTADINHTAGPVPLDGVAVIDVTGVEVHAGMLVDNKGNVTPAEGRTSRLSVAEPAYHSGPEADAPPADIHVAEIVDEKASEEPDADAEGDGREPFPEEQPHPEPPPPDKPEGE